MGIEIYRDYTFMDSNDYKYCLSVEDDFTNISYHEYNLDIGKWYKVEDLELPSTFAYEIAKKIVEEYENMNKVGKYNVYIIDPKYGYSGTSLVAAKDEKRANEIIKEFKENDKENRLYSEGYSEVYKIDLIEGVYSEKEGIISKGIYYCGEE